MDTVRTAGVALTVLGVAGYLVGVSTPYPGRSFSLTVVMVGVTLAAVGRPDRGERA